MSRIITVLLLVLTTSLTTGTARTEPLTIYTYDSFVSDWGPGPEVQKRFEVRCGCETEWVAVGDAASLLTRLRLEGAAGNADVVLGLDTNLMTEAVESGVVSEHGLGQMDFDLPITWDDPVFVPFDYGYFAVIYDSEVLTEPPASLADLMSGGSGPDFIIQDPRTSTPGLGLMLWVRTVYGDDAAAAWEDLSSRLLTVTQGWSEAYGLFLEGEAPMVLSYTTSPAYHQMVEETDRYKAAMFPEGHYMQIEVAAIAASTDQPDLARDFLSFIGTPEFQNVIPTTNWMYPAVDPGDALPSVFRELPTPEISLLLEPDAVAVHRSDWIREWQEALSR